MVLFCGSGALMVNPVPARVPILLDMAGIRKRILLVRGAVQDAAVVVEDVLCAVAMVHVPVNDGDTVHQIQGFCSSNGRVVDETEPHGPRRSSVVARGTDQGKTALPVQRAFCRGDSRSRSKGGYFVRVGIDIGIFIDIPAEKRALGKISANVHRITDEIILRVPFALLAEPFQVSGWWTRSISQGAKVRDRGG